ncbi:MAG: hypothetical protein R2835_05680 [Thermomicrobiales bacterium]
MYGAGPLDESSLTDEQLQQLEEARASIAEQVGALEGTLPGSVQEAFTQLYSPENNAVVGHFREGVAWGRIARGMRVS